MKKEQQEQQEVIVKNVKVAISADIIEDDDISDMYVMIAIILKANVNLLHTVGVSINMLLQEMGMKVNLNKGKNNDMVKEVLRDMELNNHIYILSGDNQMRQNDYMMIKLNMESGLFSPKSFFTTIGYNEFKKIVNHKSTVSNGRLVRVYLVLRKYLNKENSFVFPSIRTISNMLGVTHGANICKSTKVLEEAGVLYTYCAGSYLTNSGKRKNVNTYYAFEPNQLHGAYEHALEYIRNSGVDIDKFDPKVK